MKKFNPINVSSKFAICGLPLRVDTYKTCSFNCAYCFSNNRRIMEFEKSLQIGNIEIVKRKLEKIFDRNDVDDNNLLEKLISDRITWHCGGMSDPFQPAEEKYHITKGLIDVCNQYDISILFSTKSDEIYDADVRPDLHFFQMSVTSAENINHIERNVPDIQKRVKLYKQLKQRGFKVGIRIQPFIPNVTTIDILEMFNDADHFTLEGLKIVPQNKQHKDYLMDTLMLDKNDFKQMGLLNLKPAIRRKLYEPFITYFEKKGMSYSIADNDMHHIGNNSCCCGDKLVKKSTRFNNTAMIKKYGIGYEKKQLDDEIKAVCDCKCNYLFTSNRQEGCITVQDFYDKRFDRKSSPFSPKFLDVRCGDKDWSNENENIG